MKAVDSRSLVPGIITDRPYFSEKGELLIAKGVVITEKHIEMMARRNIFEIFVNVSEEEQLKELVSKPVITDDDLPSLDSSALTAQFKGIQSGKDGFDQLLQSSITQALDTDLRLQRINDRPVGPPLQNRAQQIQLGERTDSYKDKILEQYTIARKQVALVLNALSRNERVDGLVLRQVVERFVSVFLKDRSILLNIASTKSPPDEYLYNHSLNVCLLSINVAAALGYSENQVIEIGMGALLHDIGMMTVPKEILLKHDRLGKEEWYEVQKHPILGLHLLEHIKMLPESVPFVAYQVHERENGKGYPKMRSGRLIHRYAKVVQIADIFEAMSSPRTYRNAYVPYNTMEKLIKMTNQGLISSEIVNGFLKYSSLFPIGSIVELSDHRIAKVTEANTTSFAKPKVSLLTDFKGQLLEANEIKALDLSQHINIQIVRALPNNYFGELNLMHGF